MQKINTILLVMFFTVLIVFGWAVCFADIAGPRLCVDSMDDTSGCDYVAIKHMSLFFRAIGYNGQLGLLYVMNDGTPYLREGTYESIRLAILPIITLWGLWFLSSIFMGRKRGRS